MSFVVDSKPRGVNRVVVAVEGVLDEAAGKELSSKVEGEIGKGVSEFLLDLRGLTDCRLLGRTALRELQAKLHQQKARTAYLTATPRLRGMTLIVINGSGDPRAATFVVEDEAYEWLSSEVDRKTRNVSFTEKNA